tara:strand:- start:509 stop:739 length:231 start_codon:yes stop_codon:yes gene_type:complete
MVGRKRRYRKDGQYYYEDRDAPKVEKKEERRDYKVSKIDAKTEKAKAVAIKRKWTAILLIAVIIGLVIIKFGGFKL